MNDTKLFGLIGYPLSHSFSKAYFTKKFIKEGLSNHKFENFSIEHINEFNRIKNIQGVCGLNVTIPHKQSVIEFIDKIDPIAKEVNAVNCIKVVDKYTIGYNTDVVGFEESLKPLLKSNHTKALILGTGGAAKAVLYVLHKYKIESITVSRSKGWFLYSNIDENILKEHHLIVNATPLGMFPNVNECPTIPYKFLTKDHLLYDLIYNPKESLFLRNGKKNVASIKNGIEMLHIQAEKSWEIWQS